MSKSDNRGCSSCNKPDHGHDHDHHDHDDHHHQKPDHGIEVDCHPCKPEDICCKVPCDIDLCPPIDPQLILCKYGRAVVTIHAEVILLGADYYSRSQVNNSVANSGMANNSVVHKIQVGHGFLVKGHRIICAAQTVLVPGTLLSGANRYPASSLPAPTGISGVIPNQLVRVSRILVTVPNVNGDGCSYVYEAQLVGVSGIGDIAVLRISFRCSQWNCGNPPIKRCHPYLEFCDSRKARKGAPAMMLGNYVTGPDGNSSGSANVMITKGIISDPAYVQPAGHALQQLVVVDANAWSRAVGMPILNGQGKVIGMQTLSLSGVTPRVPTSSAVAFPYLTHSLGSGLVAGPSSYYMYRIIALIIMGVRNCGKINCHVESVPDPTGSFVRHVQGYLGMAGVLVDGSTYDVTRDYTSGPAPFGQPRIRLAPNGDFIGSPADKRIAGIQIVGLAGLSPNGMPGQPNGFYYVPGGTVTQMGSPLPSGLPVSPLASKLVPGDIITSITIERDGMYYPFNLGDSKYQIALSLILRGTCPGDQAIICYRSGGHAPNLLHGYNVQGDNYMSTNEFRIQLAALPPLMDFPWYAIDNIFPGTLVGSSAVYGIVPPATQQVNPAVPELIIPGAGHFYEAQ